MNFPLLIARRYLFGKKKTNVINIITGITVFGISVGTAALILVLSVFNGFEDLITGLFNQFNPDVKVTPIEGKTFLPDTYKLEAIKALPGVEAVSKTLEEIALFEYDGVQDFGTIKGVDDQFAKVSKIDSVIREGKYLLHNGKMESAVVGAGIANKLSINVEDPFEGISVYMPKRKIRSPMEKPFKSRFLYPAGIFSIQQEFDYEYIITSIGFARDLLDLKAEVSALEIKLSNIHDQQETITSIRELMGSEYIIKDRFQQDEAFLKLMNIEKWMSYAILCFTLLIVAFNLIGSLWMLVLDKKKDISILKSMGATNKTIRQIFLSEGMLICFLGLISGIILALGFFLSQKMFGIVPIPEGFVVDAYPVSLQLGDFVIVSITVLVVGLIASIPASLKSGKVSSFMREE